MSGVWTLCLSCALYGLFLGYEPYVDSFQVMSPLWSRLVRGGRSQVNEVMFPWDGYEAGYG